MADPLEQLTRVGHMSDLTDTDKRELEGLIRMETQKNALQDSKLFPSINLLPVSLSLYQHHYLT